MLKWRPRGISVCWHQICVDLTCSLVVSEFGIELLFMLWNDAKINYLEPMVLLFRSFVGFIIPGSRTVNGISTRKFLEFSWQSLSVLQSKCYMNSGGTIGRSDCACQS